MDGAVGAVHPGSGGHVRRHRTDGVGERAAGRLGRGLLALLLFLQPVVLYDPVLAAAAGVVALAIAPVRRVLRNRATRVLHRRRRRERRYEYHD